MNILKLSIASLFRQKRKSIFLGFLIALCCATAVILVTFVQSQEAALDIQFDSYGANILVVPKTDTLNLTYGGLQFGGIVTEVTELKADDMLRIREIPNNRNIRAVAPKILGTVDSPDAAAPIGLAGIDLEEELKIKPWWQWDGELPSEGNAILLGSEAAEMTGWKIHDTVRLGSTDYTVSGILKQNGNQDDNLVFTTLGSAEQLLGKSGRVSLAEVSALCNDCPIEELVRQIEYTIPTAEVKSLRQVMAQKMAFIETFRKYTVLLIGIMSLLCGIIVFLGMNSAVADRKKELGILRAVGYLNLHLGQLILLEVLMITILSALAGLAAGAALSLLILPALADLGRELIQIPWAFTGYALLASVGLSLSAALSPAVKAARIDPVKTLNSF